MQQLLKNPTTLTAREFWELKHVHKLAQIYEQIKCYLRSISASNTGGHGSASANGNIQSNPASNTAHVHFSNKNEKKKN